jgi:SAM-dependent methyltransferase
VKPDAVEQLLHVLVKDEFVEHDPVSGGYSLDALADVDEDGLERVLAFMNMIKVCVLRQVFYLTESVRTGKVVGLKELYDFDGILYDAMAEHRDLRESWSTLMDTETAHHDPWFFGNVDIPPGSRVLDLAGNTGLGAILTYKYRYSPGLHVTTFDLPHKEEACLANFKAHGLEEHCSFIGGDVFKKVPEGFDVVLIKHFLAMFDKDDVLKIFNEVNKSLEIGGQVNLLVPIYPENLRTEDARTVDFYPTFFLGCTMGKGGPQKLSTYKSWLEECGFTVTNVIAQSPADVPPDLLSVQAIVSATKTA